MKPLFYISFVLLISFSCKKEKSFPKEPVLVFKSYTSYNADSADCILGFTDGDGDVGFLSTDTTKDFNLEMLYLYENSAGIFVPYDYSFGTTQFDTLKYGYRIDNLTPDGQYKALEGEIKIKLRSAPLYSPLHNKVKFKITLWDRAGHASNTVETNEIAVPK